MDVAPISNEAVGPKTIPMGLIKNRFALPKSVVLKVPKICEDCPPVTRLRMFEVSGKAPVFWKFAISPAPTLKSSKL